MYTCKVTHEKMYLKIIESIATSFVTDACIYSRDGWQIKNFEVKRI